MVGGLLSRQLCVNSNVAPTGMGLHKSPDYCIINSLSRGAGDSLPVKRHLPSARACVSSAALETIKTYNHSTWFNKVSPNPLEVRRESRCFPPACGIRSIRMRTMNSGPTEGSGQDEIRGPSGQKGGVSSLPALLQHQQQQSLLVNGRQGSGHETGVARLGNKAK